MIQLTIQKKVLIKLVLYIFLAAKCLKVTRIDKKNQYLDIKFRLLQVMDNMILKNKKIDIEYYITSYSGLFLNIIICNINEHQIYMSYVLRVKNYNKKIKHQVLFLLLKL